MPRSGDRFHRRVELEFEQRVRFDFATRCRKKSIELGFGSGFRITPAVERREAAEVDDRRLDREEVERFAGQSARRFVKRHEARLSIARLAAPFGMASSVYGYAYKDK